MCECAARALRRRDEGGEGARLVVRVLIKLRRDWTVGRLHFALDENRLR
jgi:hypothetical protein